MSSPVAWLLFGLSVGIIAHHIDGKRDGGVMNPIGLGILGAVVAGLIANLLLNLGPTRYNLVSLLIAAFGSILLMVIQKNAHRF